MSDGELVMETNLKYCGDGSVLLRIERPEMADQWVSFANQDEWETFARAVAAFRGLEEDR